MRKIFIFYLSLLLHESVAAQSLRSPIAAPYLGIGAYSLHHVDVFSFSSNQASLAQMKGDAFGVYGERRFLMAELNMFSAVVAMPTTKGNFGFQADYFGYKNFNESQLGLAYAGSVGSRLDLGIKFNYYSFRIPGYGNSAAVNFEIGSIAHLTEKFHAGIHFYNPVGATFSKGQNEKLRAIYKMGVGYEASENFLISGEIIKREDLPVNVNVGIQYDFAKQFFARFGIASENGSPFGAAGISWNNLRLDVSAAYHPQLGISPGIMLIVNFKPMQLEND